MRSRHCRYRCLSSQHRRRTIACRPESARVPDIVPLSVSQQDAKRLERKLAKLLLNVVVIHANSPSENHCTSGGPVQEQSLTDHLHPNGKAAVQSVAGDVASALASFLVGRPQGRPLRPGSWHERAADMLRPDLEIAGIPYVVEGQTVDGTPISTPCGTVMSLFLIGRV
jgi:hypothetical protein